MVDSGMTATEVTLEKIRVGTQVVVSKRLLDGTVDIRESLSRMIEVHVRGFLWGNEGPRWEFRAPEDWWQALRERWMPKWILSRWPVRYRRERIDLLVLYPELRIAVPEESHVLKLMRHGSPVASLRRDAGAFAVIGEDGGLLGFVPSEVVDGHNHRS